MIGGDLDTSTCWDCGVRYEVAKVLGQLSCTRGHPKFLRIGRYSGADQEQASLTSLVSTRAAPADLGLEGPKWGVSPLP